LARFLKLLFREGCSTELTGIMGHELLVDETRVADALALTSAQVRRLVNRGDLPCRILPDGSRRIDPAELRQWIDNLRHVGELATA
jgi:hypothetical protein